MVFMFRRKCSMALESRPSKTAVTARGRESEVRRTFPVNNAECDFMSELGMRTASKSGIKRRIFQIRLVKKCGIKLTAKWLNMFVQILEAQSFGPSCARPCHGHRRG